MRQASPDLLVPEQQAGKANTYIRYYTCSIFWISELIRKELCYVNRFIEQNGRNRGDPWSLRQTGVYQKIHFDTGNSSCVILQLSKSIRKQFGHAIAEYIPGRTDQGVQIMQIHLLVLTSTADNWSEYIEHLHSLVKAVVCTAY
jgi:citrate lyase gamma subunit